MQVLGIRRLAAKASVIAVNETGQPRVCRGDCRYPRQTQLFHHPILQRAKRTLDPALRLRTVGADDVDVQRHQRTAKLRDAIPPPGASRLSKEPLSPDRSCA